MPSFLFSHLPSGPHRSLLFGFVGVIKLVDKRETAAGYTTTLAMHPELPQLDWRSGVTIRQAGERPLTRAEFRERCALARGGRYPAGRPSPQRGRIATDNQFPRIEMLAGVSALRLFQLRAAAFAPGVGFLGGAAYLALDSIFNGWTVALLVAGVIGWAVAFVLEFALRRATANELDAGYTTLRRGHSEVPRIHERTGIVMRPAGAPDLSDFEEKRLLATIYEREAAARAECF